MIEVSQLTKKYGDHVAIDSLNFTVKKGEVVGFLGPNGAGKSTTMKIITGFMAPSSGAAQIAGYDVFENPIEVKRRIGYLPETPPVYLDMNVEEYLSYVAELKGVEKERRLQLVNRAVEKTNLGQVRRRLIHNLSKGFKQRVGIAQALVSDPEVLILDEPTVGLDPKQVAEIRDLIKELRGQHTIILSTHILPEVQATCERIIIIHRGKIVAQDSLANLSALQSGGRKVHLKVRKSAAELGAKLKGIRGIQKVVSGATPQDWELDTESDDEIVETVAREIIAGGYGLLEIGSVKADLEDIFLKLTYGDSSPNGSGQRMEVHA
ncbi:MAG: MFS transporter [Bdellovibrio sp.]|nr:MAG: MFS transporter [Bdellovibrio sp.]